ncbi:TrkA domain protein [Formosa agariphila KMM 3901]|uniref:TrkA domain protein n=1 Tax=Formosa agariphila (strain DSM 15362 / KCTC 12365 / LMG 23005 / KMM 3901 / M-2Alg 35-1) TaxID=1347342 RepID=T2KM22_FORAG|nr:sodium:proton antiporter [Formosa agariphila]CDF79049.1 TrkA domain protein [Formosa agariphila KMM 3901]
MTIEIVIIFVILGLSLIFFALELFSIDKISIFVLASLLLAGFLSPEEALTGFSNTATITILMLMIIAIAMEQNGVINMLSKSMTKLKGMPLLLLIPVIMFIVAGISAFISTTAVVIVFVKLTNELHQRYGISQSKLLLPISFAGILGGSCTLMGTSTNLIVNAIAEQSGVPKLSFFEFTNYGLIFLGVGVVVVTALSFVLPYDSKKTKDFQKELQDFITKLCINKESSLIGKTIGETFLFTNQNVQLLKMTRDGITTNAPGKYITLKEGDILLVNASMDNLLKAKETEGITLFNEVVAEEHEDEDNSEEVKQEVNKDTHIVELLILPNSNLLGLRLGDIKPAMIMEANPLAIKKRINMRNTKERLIRKREDKIRLKVSDRLLIQIDEDDIDKLEGIEHVVVMQQLSSSTFPNARKKYISLTILLITIGLAASGLFPIVKSTIIGVFLLLVFNCLKLNTVYKDINWEVIFLLACLIPIGIAMKNTGAETWLSENLIGMLQGQSPMLVIASLFGITMLFSGVISNNATAIIMTPIALSVAAGLNLDPKFFILSVLFAANFSFFTPMGYQTNTIIYGLGIYSFRHFAIIGGVLSVILWVLATFLFSENI